MTETTPIAEHARWPRWVWGVLAMLAIVIGGGLGYMVAHSDDESTSDPTPVQATLPPQPESKPTIEPILPAVTPPAPVVAPEPSTTEPLVNTKPAVVHHVPIKSKPPKQKPSRTTPCNVYDHIDGC